MSNKFTRSGNVHRGGEGGVQPQNAQGRIYGQQVALGEPFQIQGDAQIRQEIETSLEFLAKQHLLEAEDKASSLLAKARADAAGILEKANAQAKEMLQQVQEQVDGIREAAHEEGFKTGFQEGYADATTQVEQETVELLKAAHTLVEGAYEAEKRVLKEFEIHAADLIRQVTGRVLRRELDDSPETLLALIDQAIESLYLSGKVQVVVSAQAVQDLRDYSARIKDGLDQMHRFELIADPNLDLHQIYIIGQEGCFDLSPNNQVEQLLKPLESHLNLPRPQRAETSVSPMMPEQIKISADTETLATEPDEAPEHHEHEEEIMQSALPAISQEMGSAAEEALSESSLETLDALAADIPKMDALNTLVPTDEANDLASSEPVVEAAPYEFPSFDEEAGIPSSEESEPEAP